MMWTQAQSMLYSKKWITLRQSAACSMLAVMTDMRNPSWRISLQALTDRLMLLRISRSAVRRSASASSVSQAVLCWKILLFIPITAARSKLQKRAEAGIVSAVWSVLQEVVIKRKVPLQTAQFPAIRFGIIMKTTRVGAAATSAALSAWQTWILQIAPL